MIAVDFSKFEVLTFDCYGTLIDWESGILAALAPLRARSEKGRTDDECLERYAALESDIEAGEYMKYRDVLAIVAREMASFLDVSLDRPDEGFIADSIAGWKPFPDSNEALERLSRRFRLAVISNIDDDLFANSERNLGIEFECVVTAQSVRSYKPSHNNFLRAFERIGLPRERILHVAQSLYHDIIPAGELGLSNVWVNRRHGRPGAGATAPASAVPGLEVASLAELAGMAVTR
jgi:2-haloacid dehalogenase